MRLLHNNQRGFTLIELIIAIAITGIITGGITMSIFQVFDGNTRSTNHMIAVRQVQNAGYWLSQDAQMAQSVDTTDDPGTPELELVTLTWTDRNGDEQEVVYTLLADNTLQREHYTNRDNPDPDPDVTTIVAQYIDPDPAKTNVEFTAGGELIFTVTTTVATGSQESSETREYRIIPRPGS